MTLPRLSTEAPGESFREGGLPRVESAFAPGLAAAVTTRELDFGRHTESRAREVAAAHRALLDWAATGFDLVVGGSQVHGTRLFHADGVRVPEGDRRAPATVRVASYDGFLASRPGVLLTVGIADCVPAFLAAPGRGAVALLHAGWRGVAGEIVPLAIAALESELRRARRRDAGLVGSGHRPLLLSGGPRGRRGDRGYGRGRAHGGLAGCGRAHGARRPAGRAEPSGRGGGRAAGSDIFLAALHFV